MKILYADTDHVSQVNFINALKGQSEWSAKYAMAVPAIGNALNNENFNLIVCSVNFVKEILTVAKDNTEIIAIGDLEDYNEIEQLLNSGVHHFMKHPFCAATFREIASNAKIETEISENDVLPDFEYLDRLTKGRTALKLDLMEIFVAVVTEELERIDVAIIEKNVDSIGKSAHKMKSNVRMMGLQTLMQLLDTIEDQSKLEICCSFYDLVKDCCDMLQQSVIIVKAEIEKYKTVTAE